MPGDLSNLLDFILLLLRIVVAIIFFSSGKSHLIHAHERSQQVGLPKNMTQLLGITEIVGALSIAFGLFTHIGAILLIIVMVGAIYKKIFIWNVGFYSDEGFGWHYDLLLLLANLLFLSEPGRFVITP